jgi:hypothetical protein
MDFNSWATLHFGFPTDEGVLSEKGKLRGLIRKVLEMPSTERQRCYIVVGNFKYRRAEIEALSRHPDFSEMKRARGNSAGLRCQSRRAASPAGS